MKKLMTMLGVVSLSVAPAAVLISCAKENQNLDDDGNSIILEFGKGIGKDGITQLDAKGILDAIKSRPNFKNKILQDVLSVINHSFLNNLDLFFDTKDEEGNNLDESAVTPKNKDFKFYDDSTYFTLNNAWRNLKESVDQQLSYEKEALKKEHGKKKWEKKWKEKLVAKFPNYQKDADDADLPFLEEKYKMSLLITGDDNLDSKVQKILIDNNHSGVEWIGSIELNGIWTKHSSLMGDEEKYIAKIIDPNQSLLRKEFAQLYNAQFTEVKDMISVNELKDAEIVKSKMEAISAFWKDTAKVVNSIPDEVGNLSVNGYGVNGILSNTQNYFLDSYFKTKAPVVISQVTFGYTAGTTFEKGINENSIQNNQGSSNPATQFNSFLDEAKEVSNNSSWISLITDPEFSTKFGGTVTKADSIMTIDGEQDSYLKTAVYSSILGVNQGDAGTPTSPPTFEGESDKDTVKFLNDINRTSEKTMFQTIGKDKNIVAFADAAGVHFVYLHGGVKSGADSKDKVDASGYQRLEGVVDGKISEELFKQQKDLNEFNNKSREIKISLVEDYSTEKTDPGYLANINSSIDNNYAKYLINNSLVAATDGSFSTYDFVGKMKEWAKSSSASSDSSLDAKLAIYDYFKNMIDGNPNDEEFLSQFIQFGKDDKDPYGKELLTLISSMIETIRLGSHVTSAMAMEKQYNELEKTIDLIKENNGDPKLDPPTWKFEYKFNANDTVEQINKKYKLFNTKQESFDYALNYIIKGGK